MVKECSGVELFVSFEVGQVGVLPKVDSHNRDALNINDSMHERIVLVICLSHKQAA